MPSELVGVCFLPDGTDIGGEIIRRGLALDCSHFSGSKYRTLEPDAVRERPRPGLRVPCEMTTEPLARAPANFAECGRHEKAAPGSRDAAKP
jgi:hypothetical protein